MTLRSPVSSGPREGERTSLCILLNIPLDYVVAINRNQYFEIRMLQEENIVIYSISGADLIVNGSDTYQTNTEKALQNPNQYTNTATEHIRTNA